MKTTNAHLGWLVIDENRTAHSLVLQFVDGVPQIIMSHCGAVSLLAAEHHDRAITLGEQSLPRRCGRCLRSKAAMRYRARGMS